MKKFNKKQIEKSRGFIDEALKAVMFFSSNDFTFCCCCCYCCWWVGGVIPFFVFFFFFFCIICIEYFMGCVLFPIIFVFNFRFNHFLPI